MSDTNGSRGLSECLQSDSVNNLYYLCEQALIELLAVNDFRLYSALLPLTIVTRAACPRHGLNTINVSISTAAVPSSAYLTVRSKITLQSTSSINP